MASIYVKYRVDGHEEHQYAGPYPTLDLAEEHERDIASYARVTDVELSLYLPGLGPREPLAPPTE